MNNQELKTVDCSNCGSRIEKNYCPECGQFYNPKRLTAAGFVSDFIDTFFALHKSYVLNLKHLLIRPRFVVENYWNGYRNFYFSPNRMLLFTTLLLALYLYFFENTFLGINFEVESVPWLGVQFFITALFLFFFILSTIITYFKKKKNLFEHLALNAYIFSIITSIFLILSDLLKYFYLADFLQLIFIFCYCLWIARVFERKWWWILGMALLNSILFILITGVPTYFLINMKQ